MRFTRHARNRLRLLQRTAGVLSAEAILEAISLAEPRGIDVRGNRRVAVTIDSIGLIIVIDDTRDIVVTIWRED